MKIGIIGAGVSGLSVAQLLGAKYEVEILERDSQIGGIAKVKMIDGAPYHMVGGHCLNSKNTEVMDFVYKILPKEHWHSIKRVAKIAFKGNLIDYPIEFSIPQIAKFNESLAYQMTVDFMNTESREAENLDDWFRIQFGTTLAEEYFIPYNTKIWGMAPSKMSPSWVDGKLPIPNKKQFFKSLLGSEKDSMPHAVFNYPNKNTQNEFLYALGQGLNITKNYNVVSLERLGGKWIVNGEKIFDALISTIPLNVVPFIIVDTPNEVKNAARLLKYNKISNMLWETDGVEATWTYYPEASTIFHRHIHIGNFLAPTSNYTITEAMGEWSREQMESEGAKFDYLKKSIDYHISDHAYVVFDQNYPVSVKKIQDYLTSKEIYTLGRFGEWEYYNMDVCIEKAMRIAEKFNIRIADYQKNMI